MASISVHLEVPEIIAKGLHEGSMERVGGVIRHSDSKQIIAWLREGGQAVDDAVLKTGLLDDVLRAAGSASTTVGFLLGGLFPILDIAIAGYVLLEIIGHIDDHRHEIEEIYKRIEEEFRQDRLANLATALTSARLVSQVKDVAFKRQMVGQATDRLLEAREHLREDFMTLVKEEMNEEDAITAMRYQILSMQAATLIVRAWLEIGEKDLAREWLGGILMGQRERVKLFVRAQIGEHPSLYFHETVSEEDFARYVNVERWLRGKRIVLPEIVKEYRSDFWDGSVVGELFTGGLNSQPKEQPFYLDSLRNCEFLIENYQRLEGFDLELKSMCFDDFAQWDAFDGSNGISIAQQSGVVMLVNSSLLDSEL